MTRAITDGTFEAEVKSKRGYALIDFWAEWCGPCRQVGPIIDELATEMADKVDIMKMNIDQNPDTPTTLGVRSIPTMILFKDGKHISTKVGSLPKSALQDWLNSEMND